RTEADLRQAPVQWHLAALEAGLDLAAAGARVLALVAAAGGLAQARADAAPDAHAITTRALCGFQCIEFHRSVLDANQVVHGLDQTAHLRAVLQFAHVVGLVQTERLDAQAMPALHAAQAADQAHLYRAGGICILLSHCPAPLRPSCRAWPRCAQAKPSISGP